MDRCKNIQLHCYLLSQALLLLFSSAQHASANDHQQSSSTSTLSTTLPPSNSSANVTCRDRRPTCGEGKPPLYLLAMAPYPHDSGDPAFEPSWPGGPVVIPGALLAAEHINCHPDILPDYQIKIIISDGGCQLGNRASVNLTSAVYLTNYSDGNVVGIVGGACSESAFTVAKLVHRDKLSLVQIAPTATSPIFVEEKQNYQNTIRLVVNALVFTNVFKEIIEEKNYSEIAILYDADRPYMVAVADAFVKALEDINVKVSSFQPLLDSYLSEPLDNLIGKNRVIFVLAGSTIAINTLCIAYCKHMRYPDYQFIFINRRVKNFLKNVTVNDTDTDKVLYNCTKKEMEEAIETATLFEPRAKRNESDNNTIISDYTFNEIEKQYECFLQEHIDSLNISNDSLVDTDYENAYYDSTWALALSLHYSQPLINLSTYRYGQPNETKIIFQQFFNLSFEGATGLVEFSKETCDVKDVAIVDIRQQINGSVVAFHSPQTNLTVLPGAMFLSDSIFRNTTFIHPPIWLGYSAIVVAILVFLGIGMLHYLNGTLGDVKLAKATSFQLNHLIFSGCYLLLLGVIAYSCLSTIFVANSAPNAPDGVLFGVFCNIQVWVSTHSFSLIFGTICMKTWRIWRIFSHFSSNPLKYAGDYILVSIVVVLVLVDTVYLLIWTSVDPLTMLVRGTTTNKIAICYGDNLQWWLPILLTYKVVVIFVVLYLSISTRKVNRQEFKQTKSINTLIYILLLVTVLGIAPYAIVAASQTFEHDSIVTAFVLYSGAFVFIAITCAIFVSLPPIYPELQKKWKRWRLSSYSL